MRVKWTLQWLFVSIILGLDYLQKINATPNEGAVSYIPALECYDPYGKPQVNIQFASVFFITNILLHCKHKILGERIETCIKYEIYLVSAFIKFSKNATSTL